MCFPIAMINFYVLLPDENNILKCNTLFFCVDKCVLLHKSIIFCDFCDLQIKTAFAYKAARNFAICCGIASCLATILLISIRLKN